MSPTSVIANMDMESGEWIPVEHSSTESHLLAKVVKPGPGIPVDSTFLPVGRIYDLLKDVSGPYTPEYADKMLHKVPDAPVFDRSEYLMKAARGNVVLDIGASGPMAEALQKVAKEYWGIDIEPNPAIKNMVVVDLEYDDALDAVLNAVPHVLDLIIAGEIIEHLSNAGHFLDLLHSANVPVILTTPNAFSTSGKHFLADSIENVNEEHVAWYSYHTLKTLIERHSFILRMWAWYNGKPLTAEGLIFHMEPDHGND